MFVTIRFPRCINLLLLFIFKQTTQEYPLGNKPITFRYLVCSLRHLSSLGLFLIKTRAVVTETAFTITSTVFTLETRSLFTRKGRISSLVSVGNNISREVKELSKILKTRISKSVIEVAPTDQYFFNIQYQQ